MATTKRTCSFDGCEFPHNAHGLCAAHNVQRSRGLALRPVARHVPHSLPLMERIALMSEDHPSGCRVWTASLTSGGHAQLRHNGRARAVHRIVFEAVNGPIPAGMMIDHMCRTRRCVKPEHLQLATAKTNAENLVGAAKRSKSGVRGVYFDPATGRWAAETTHHRRRHWIGRFDSLEAAEAAAIAKRNELFTNNLADRV